MQERHKAWAIASLVCGIVGALSILCCGIVGLPVVLVTVIAGFVCGFLGLRSDLRGLAIAGMVVNALSIVLAILVVSLNLWLIESHQHPLFPNGLEGGIELPQPPRRPMPPVDPSVPPEPGLPPDPAAPLDPFPPADPAPSTEPTSPTDPPPR